MLVVKKQVHLEFFYETLYYLRIGFAD